MFHNLHPAAAILIQHPLGDQNLHSTGERHLNLVQSEGGTLPHPRHCTKRLEAAFRLFDEHCRIYQYLLKRNGAAIPHQKYQNPIVKAAIENRIAYLESKSDNLYDLQIYYVVLLEADKARAAWSQVLNAIGKDPKRASKELRGLLSAKGEIALVAEEITRNRNRLEQKVSSFVLQVSDFLDVKTLDKEEVFRFLKRLLNFDALKIECAGLKHDTFLDYYLCESHLECHRGFLRVDDNYVKVLTLREPSAQSFPLIFQKLLEVGANFFIATEWRKESPDKTRSRIHSRRRHFHNTKRSLVSYMNTSEAPTAAQDVLIDDSKEAQVQSLGEALKEFEVNGSYFGEFSLTVVIYDLDLLKVESACADFYKVFSVHDAQLYDERYNLLNAYLATVPGNQAFNLRRISISNANYADYSFLFTLHSGDRENQHLKKEYLAVLETNHQTPYFLNLHHHDVAHTVILGRTGSGKSFLLNFLITNLQKYEPYTFIFDLGGSFGSLTRLFAGSYVRVGIESRDFKINPFSLPPTKRNLDFLTLFCRVLAESQAGEAITATQERDLYEQIQNLYELDDSSLHTLGTLGNTLRRDLDQRLYKWKENGQFGFLFDNAEDTVSFSRFQCFDFQGMREYSPTEAEFLYLVATHSGYFTRNQFLRYTGFKKGCLVHRLTTRAIALKHATVKQYGQTHIYHLFSRQIYGAIHKDNLRNRRDLSKELIRARLLILDFVLSHSELQYLETEADKVGYFHGELGIPLSILPSRTYKSLQSDSQTVRYFVDRFPVVIEKDSLTTPIFVYCDSDLPGLFSFATYLRNHQELFRRLPGFKLIYAAPGSLKIAPAQRLFQRMFAPNESVDAVKLVRYFRVRQLWENHQTGLLTRADRDLLRRETRNFTQRYSMGYITSGQTESSPMSEIANQTRTTSNTQSSCFETCLLPESYGIFHQINCAPIRPPAEIQRSNLRSSSDIAGTEAKFMKAQGL